MHRDVVFVVEEDIASDKRVLAALAEYSGADVFDCASEELANGTPSIRTYLNGAWFLIVAALRGAALWHLLRWHCGLQANKWVAGLLISFRTFVRAQQVAGRLQSGMNGVRLIHSHDLYCGVIGAKLAKRLGAKFIYDAHEVEFHRNRKNSWLRSAFDWSVEKNVIEAADEIRVVNTRIAELYCLVYPEINSRLRVVSNDHFVPLSVDIDVILNCENVTIVYVGQGVRGRQLEQLALITKDSELSVYAFFIGEVPAFALNAQWIIGPRDYEDDLVALVQSQRCMMWCCVENICLSYQLALPNKFFQALAVGMPVIVSKDTYLSEIVNKYKIGIVLDDNDSNWILEHIKSDQFIEWVENIILLRDDLSKGLVVL